MTSLPTSDRFNRTQRSTPFVMGHVMLALIPGTVVTAHWLGPGVILNLIIVVLTAVVSEAILTRLRGRSAIDAVNDGSIVLAAWLLALCLPPSLPMAQLMVGAVAMTTLGKHVYGGIGQNLFNPAMVGYAVLLISFPKTMTSWLDPYQYTTLSNWAVWESWLQLKWFGNINEAPWDAITQATPLDTLRTQARYSSLADTNELSLFHPPWWSLCLAWCIGGAYLLARKIIRWQIPVAMLLASALSLMCVAFLTEQTVQRSLHTLLYGAIVFGAFFIATDPVTAPSSVQARLIYGAAIGLITVLLRTTSNYPEGVAFAVLLMNATAPLLDRMFVRDSRA